MSEDALRYVRNCTHPLVKDGTRDLFEAIAHFVPEGETTTPRIGMPALADQARRHRRTVVKRLQDLVDIGEVNVLDGGLGKIARYQIVHLDGAPPIVAAPLPLRADLQPVERRPTLPDDTTGDLFADDPPASVRSESEEPVLIDHRLARNLWRSITGWAAQPVLIVHRLVSYLWRSITGWRSDSEEPVAIDHRLPIEPVIDRRVLTTARDVHTLKEHTHTAAPRDGPPPLAAAKPPPCPFAAKHAWCGSLVCVPTGLHQDFLRKGHDADWLVAFYARTHEALPRGVKIAVNDYTFWRTALKVELAGIPVHERTPTPGPRHRPDIPHTRSCPHEPSCVDQSACVDRMMAEWQAEKDRKSG